MRHVYLNPSSHDTTQAQSHMRSFMDKDLRGFIAQMTAMESDHKAQQPHAEGVLDEDVGTEKALALCREWLEQHGEKPEIDHG